MKPRTLLFLFLYTLTFPLLAQIYLDPNASTDERVADLLSRMTLDEKIGQMTQAERGAVAGNTQVRDLFLGSILSGGGSTPQVNSASAWADMYDGFQALALETRLKIPLIYGVDAVHGHNNVKGAVIFPHNIGLGSTWNPELVQETQRVAAMEVAGTGIDWTFSPCIAVPRDERWGRTYEGFAETPTLTRTMSRASVLGLQGIDLSDPKTIAACAKHYVADGATSGGIDQGDAEINEAELRSIHLPGYIEAIDAGVATIMASFNSWNGIKLHGHKYLMTDVLKDELGFDGFIVSDWEGIQQLPGDFTQDVKQSINAGIDMVMAPYTYSEFISTLSGLVNSGDVSQSRIDDAVSRILRVKFDLGLFEEPLTNRALTDSVGIERHRDIARQAVRESLVLLKKENGILPLDVESGRILVAGSHANDLGYQCGGWSISWQGSGGNITEGTTILAGLQNRTQGAEIIFDEEDVNGHDADVALVVIGERPYAEGGGDDSDLHVDNAAKQVIRRIKNRGIPTIVLLLSGRPMIIDDIIHSSDVFIAGWLPGTEGAGVADILFGDYEPTGKLTHSWPREMAQIPINWGDADYNPLFVYEHGIQTSSDFGPEIAIKFQSAQLNSAGDSLVVALDRPIAPSVSQAGFSVFAGMSELNIQAAQIDAGDQHNLTLVLAETPALGESLHISYDSGVIAGTDGSQLESFVMEDVYDLRAEGAPHPVPGRIEAEHFVNSAGVQLESTSDVGGGENVGWIDSGDWMDYNLDVSHTGVYEVLLRVASQSQAGSFTLSSGDTSHTIEVDVPITGGWQNWQTISSQMSLDSGEQTMTLSVLEGGFNLNWMEFDLASSNSTEHQLSTFQLYQPYPNPFNSELTINYALPKPGDVTVRVFDILGREIERLYSEFTQAGSHEVSWQSAAYPTGTYFIQVEFENTSQVEKCVLLK